MKRFRQVIEWLRAPRMRPVYLIGICLSIAAYSYISIYPEYVWTRMYDGWAIIGERKNLQIVNDALHEFRDQNGRYPTNEEGIASAMPADSIWKDSIKERPRVKLGAAGMISPWGVPYVYENRIGLDPQLFADSPVQNDKGHYYSNKVDEDVFVYSIGCIPVAQEYIKLNRAKMIASDTAIGGIVLFAILWIICRARPRSRVRQAAGVIAGAFGIFLSFFVPQVFSVSCYEPMPYGEWRKGEVMVDYYDLLQKFRARGIIADEGYEKLENALKEELRRGGHWETDETEKLAYRLGVTRDKE
jgi:hypothetical protein